MLQPAPRRPTAGPARLLLRIPVEYRVALLFTAVWAGGVAAGLPVSVPSRDNVRGLEVHFFWPLAIAAGLQLALTLGLVAAGRRRPGGTPWRAATTMVRLVPLVTLCVFLYFNFKAWTPFVNPVLHDRTYQRLDEAMAPVLGALVAVREAVAAAVPLAVDDWYGWLFFSMFFVSLGVHGLVDSPHRQRQLVLGLCLNLCVGGLSYWLAPAIGPFLFRDGVNETVLEFQHGWYAAYSEVRVTGAFPEGYFSVPLGAMPSLHVAHSLLFVLFAARSARWLLAAYLPVFAWIVVEAPASGWHYLVDLPAGVAVALLSWTLATRLVREPARPAEARPVPAAPAPGGPPARTESARQLRARPEPALAAAERRDPVVDVPATRAGADALQV